MENEYFGILTKEIYNSFSKDELHDFLYKNRLTQASVSLNFAEKKDSKHVNGVELVFRGCLSNKIYKYSTSLVNELYLFLKEYMIKAIETNLSMFNRNFEIKTYGYSNKKKKKVALKEFNRLFYEICEEGQIGFDKNSNNEIGAAKRLPTLIQTREYLIGILKDENDITINYIFGNINYFSRELFDKTPYLQTVFEFENKLSILIDLNKKFQFEEDDVFTPKTKAQMIFDKNSEEFHSLEQLVFIEQQLFDNKNKNHAFIVSLFYFFRDEINVKIPKADLFQNIIIDHFSFSFGKIKLSDPTNMNHEKRIKKMKNDWVKFLN